MKVLITGATGLLGYAVTERLLKKQSITTVVRTRTSGCQNTEIIADLSQNFDTSTWPTDIDVLIHLAQSPHYRAFPEKASDVFNINCASTAKLLAYAQQTKVKHFIYTSTGSIYEPYQSILNENDYLNPISFYANSKLAAERLCLAYQSFFKVSILRLFFLYGPHPTSKQTLINQLVTRIQHHQTVSIDGPGEGLIFVPTLTTDIARCIELIIEKELDGLLNIANPESISMEMLINTIANQLDCTPVIQRNLEKTGAKIVPDLKQMQSLLPEMQFASFARGLRFLLDYSPENDHSSIREH